MSLKTKGPVLVLEDGGRSRGTLVTELEAVRAELRETQLGRRVDEHRVPTLIECAAEAVVILDNALTHRIDEPGWHTGSRPNLQHAAGRGGL